MVLPNNNRNELEQLKSILNKVKSNADKSKAQEEYLLNQLKKDFEVNQLEEAIELLEILIDEKKEYDIQIKQKTNELIQGMQREGFL